MGYFSAHSIGSMRRVIDVCRLTEDLIAHKLPDFVGSLPPRSSSSWRFLFDWRMGLQCLVPITVSFAAMWWMMGREDEKAAAISHGTLPGGSHRV